MPCTEHVLNNRNRVSGANGHCSYSWRDAQLIKQYGCRIESLFIGEILIRKRIHGIPYESRDYTCVLPCNYPLPEIIILGYHDWRRSKVIGIICCDINPDRVVCVHFSFTEKYLFSLFCFFINLKVVEHIVSHPAFSIFRQGAGSAVVGGLKIICRIGNKCVQIDLTSRGVFRKNLS